METVEYQVEFAPMGQREGVPVVVVAAGSSTRMGGIDKQFAKINGTPVLAHTLLAFERSDIISKIIVVTSKEMVSKVENLADEYLISKISCVVVGANTRFGSVLCGLEKIKNEKYALIHDGARPLVCDKVINCVCAQLPHADGVVCTVPVNDTIKIIAENGAISTLERDRLLSAQTPQGVDVEKYFDAVSKNKFEAFTDDASVLELAGYKVISVQGDYKNIKITRPEDLELAQFYFEKRGLEE